MSFHLHEDEAPVPTLDQGSAHTGESEVKADGDSSTADELSGLGVVPDALDSSPDDEAHLPADVGSAPTDDRAPSSVGPDVEVLLAAVEELRVEVHRSNERAVHREQVIDTLHAELEVLRRGERRSMLRPPLTVAARLRDDLLRQATSLPADFDTARMAKLLASFADSLELMLDDNGVSIEQPRVGDPFDPKRHRAQAKVDSTDASLVNRIAEVRRAGYLDLESGAVLSHAEVTIYALAVTLPDEPVDVTTPAG